MVFLINSILLLILSGCSAWQDKPIEEEMKAYALEERFDNYSKILNSVEQQNLDKVLNVSSDMALQLKDEILYIKLFYFHKQSANNIKMYLQKYKQSKGIILDLRNNPGGLLNESLAILNIFIDKGVLLKRVQKYNVLIERAIGNSTTSLPLVILVNKKSASASEIVSGVLQERKRAIIIGETTFGKGSIQDIVIFKKKKLFKVTTEYYHLPSGKNINNVGIVPDISIKHNKIYKIKKDFKSYRVLFRELKFKQKDIPLVLAQMILAD
ncbi:MAG TPA: hypothetical protein EYG73_06705 [Arcobacter sp.]|nr:hypothetical protein [Arcobacter sp.]